MSRTNGLMFYLWVISWLRSQGVREKIVFTVDHGEEWGGKSWMKVREEGYAVDNMEYEEGVRCIAGSIRDYTGKVIASMSISGPV